ncbi:MAG: peptidase M23 [Bacteroidetes bacterium]|nr:MAG: peptidase M23 [Bacteroidota bacterium]
MEITKLLLKHNEQPAPIFKPELNRDNTLFLDFSTNNAELKEVDFADVKALNKFIFSKIRNADKTYGYGGYMEDREVYRRSSVFYISARESRSIHLGIDVWTQAEKPLHCPLDGKVHSFKNNIRHGDYGPTIVIEHMLGNQKFYTLYGHLSKESLYGLYAGKAISKGDLLAYVGDSSVNGDWPPHLHFQVITDMKDKNGDYPGVCSRAEIEQYRELCPDPIAFFSFD